MSSASSSNPFGKQVIQPLSTAHLASWTALNPPDASDTVERFRRSQARQQYLPKSIQNSPRKSGPPSSPPARNPLQINSDDNRERASETAMVLGGIDTRIEVKKVEQKEASLVRVKMVDAMKPRTVREVKSTPPMSTNLVGGRSSSPLIESRIDRGIRLAAERDSIDFGKENRVVESAIKKKELKGKQREISIVQPPSPKKKVKKVAESSGSEDEEAVQRLAARKSRRRATALIIKDTTQTSAARGAAAASKLKQSKRKSKEAENEEAASSQDLDRSKKRRKSQGRIEEAREELQGRDKAKNIGKSRLTLPPNLKLGIFGNGAASVRTKVKPSKRLPEFGFSELAFLDGPRHETSSNSESPPPTRKAIKTYHSKGSNPKLPKSLKVKEKETNLKKSNSKYFDSRAPSPSISAQSQGSLSMIASSSPKKKSTRQVIAKPALKLTRKAQIQEKQMNVPSSRASQNSAFSNEGRKRVEKGNESNGELEEMVIDTSLAWKPPHNLSGDIHIDSPLLSPVVSSIPLEGLSPINYSLHPVHQSASGAVPQRSSNNISHLDRLLQACEDGEFQESLQNSRCISPVIPSPINIYEDEDNGFDISNAGGILDSTRFQSNFLLPDFTSQPFPPPPNNYSPAQFGLDSTDSGDYYSFEPNLENFENYQATLTASDPIDFVQEQEQRLSSSFLPAQLEPMEFQGDLWSGQDGSVDEMETRELGNNFLDSGQRMGAYDAQSATEEPDEAALAEKREFQLAMKSHWRIAKP